MIMSFLFFLFFFFFNDTATTEIYTLFPTRRSSDLEPCAHDAEAAHDGGRRRVGDPEVLLESGGGEKDLDQLTRDVSDGELPEQLRLALQTLRHAVFQPMLHRLQRGERRGVVAARLREYLLPRGPEDQGPAQRVAVEQP